MDDIFDDILDLEEGFYNEGYSQGWEDGVVSGRIEGRSLGMEKGFEKFFEAGRLYGRALLWANRLPTRDQNQEHKDGKQQKLPPLSNNQRLERNITALHDLMEPDTLPTKNTDDTVEDVNDRIRKAQGKLRVIERMVGEESSKAESRGASKEPGAKSGDMEDASSINPAALSSA
ncbi:hypothetical protein MKZ38_001527 [Zalerion maritima]|uniref:Essential protein Yae1 N-terminal domain-containing protein n=1 Tax=Zalerion maritima TaxID=339359 RepID=A0AAD5RR46_9PEZI|nr:hypothetical protein MKZ38_001527 [Zalerion maritima]